jgi:hypothetical protein
MKNKKEIKIQFQNKPVKKFRSGNIEGAIWVNKKLTDNGEIEFKSASISRSYKKDDEWHSDVINLRRLDLPKMQVVLHKLQEELFLSEEIKEADEND